MVDENLISSIEVAQLLGISMNNLRQIQHRKQLCWVKKVGRQVYYKREEAEALQRKRQEKNG
jgi:hypothetical protein